MARRLPPNSSRVTRRPMGVHKLWSLLRPTGRRVTLEELGGKRLAIDASIWLNQFVKAMRDSKGNLLANAPLKGLFSRILKLLFYKIKPVFVFDGSTPAIKKKTTQKRRLAKEQANQKAQAAARSLLLHQHALNTLKESTGNTQKTGDTQSTGDVQKTGDTPTVPYNRLGNIEVQDMELDQTEEQEGEEVEVGSSSTLLDSILSGDNMELERLNMDRSVFVALPPELQKEVLEEIKHKRSRSRRSTAYTGEIKVIPSPSCFSEMQVASLINTGERARSLSTILSSVASPDGKRQKIASDRNRNFILLSSEDKAEAADKEARKRAEEEEREFRERMRREATAVFEDPVPVVKQEMAGFFIGENEDSIEWEGGGTVKKEEGTDTEFSTEGRERIADDMVWVEGRNIREKETEELEITGATMDNAGVWLDNMEAEDFEQQGSPIHGEEKSQEVNSRQGETQQIECETETLRGSAKTNERSMGGESDSIDASQDLNTDKSQKGIQEETNAEKTGDKIDIHDVVRDIEERETPDYNPGIVLSDIEWEEKDTQTHNTPKHIQEIDVEWEESAEKTRLEPTEHEHNTPKHIQEIDVEWEETTEKTRPEPTEHDTIDFSDVVCNVEENKSPRHNQEIVISDIEWEEDDTDMGRKESHKDIQHIDLSDIEWEEKDTEKSIQEVQEIDLSDIEWEEVKATDRIERQVFSISDSDDEVIMTSAKKDFQESRTSTAQKVIRLNPDEGLHIVFDPTSLEVDGADDIFFGLEGEEEKDEEKDEEEKEEKKGGEGERESEIQDVIESRNSTRMPSGRTTEDKEEEELERLITYLDSEEEDLELDDSVEEDGSMRADYTGETDISKGVDASREVENTEETEKKERGGVMKNRNPETVIDCISTDSSEDFLEILGKEDEGEVDENDWSRERGEFLGNPESDGTQDMYRIVGPLPTDKEGLNALYPEKEKQKEKRAPIHGTYHNVDAISTEGGLDGDLIREQIGELQGRYNAQVQRGESITDALVFESQKLLRFFGIPFITSPTEADPQCAILEALGHVDGIVSDDNDMFLFGAKKMYGNVFHANDHPVLYTNKNIFNDVGLTKEDLISLAYLLGSDYTDGIKGIGPTLALEIIQEFKDPILHTTMNTLSAFAKWINNKDSENDSSWKRKHKALKKKLKVPQDFPNQAVEKAYLDPTVDKSKEPFSWAVPNLNSLRLFTAEKFGWSQQMTDDKILPAIKSYNTPFQKATPQQGQTSLFSFFSSKEPKNREPVGTIQSKRVLAVVNKLKGIKATDADTESEGTTTSEPKRKGGASPKKTVSPTRKKRVSTKKDSEPKKKGSSPGKKRVAATTKSKESPPKKSASAEKKKASPKKRKRDDNTEASEPKKRKKANSEEKEKLEPKKRKKVTSATEKEKSEPKKRATKTKTREKPEPKNTGSEKAKKAEKADKAEKAEKSVEPKSSEEK
eukprot:TRINITY_DN2867_c0_g1_i1.p1 TRINITY_DN2867_c0_g1~~TRINITY_DN2867_c0_g1_i1.p1  ORF type:complete len:1447 (-),score=394.14 TRINITY_DN2867_c0_g1_i1:18-4358(-)